MQIKRKVNGQVTTIFSTPINKGCERKWELQGDDYITLKFSVSEPIAFKIGDYTDTTESEGGEDGRWYITSAVRPTYNKAKGEFAYEIKFEAEYKLWNNYVNKYITSTAETNWKLTADIRTHLDQILRNLDVLGLRQSWSGADYNYQIDDEVYDSENHVVSGVVSNEAKYVEYSNTKICDALTAIADAWECEWWVEGTMIYFGYCEHENIINELRLGDNVESWDIEEPSGVHANKIYVFGSTRNIPSNYRRSLLISTATQEKADAGYYKITDNNVKLSLKQIVIAEQLDRSEYMGLKSAGTCETISADKGYDEAYAQSRLFERTTTTDYIYEGMPHKINFGNNQKPVATPFVTIKIKPQEVVDQQYVGDNQPGFVGDEVSFTLLVKVYIVTNETTKLFEKQLRFEEHTDDEMSEFNEVVKLEDINTFGDGANLGLDMEVHVRNDYGSKVSVTNISVTNVMSQTLLAKNFKASFVDSYLITKDDDVRVFCGYQGLSAPAEGASQNEKWAYEFDQKQKGIYYIFKRTNGYRILVPKASTQGDIPMSWYTDNFQSDSLYALAERRLMLPEGNSYIQQEGLNDLEIVEDVVTLDDVYPRMKDMTIAELIWHEEDGVLTKYEDGTEKRERYKAYYFRDSVYKETGKQCMKEEYVLSGQTARVRFASGRLNGMEFDLDLESGYTDAAGTTYSNYHKIIRNEDYGTKLPNSYLYPEVGDKIIYLGWDEAQMGNTGFVEAAENELLAKGKEYLAKARINDRTYNITLMEPSRYGTSNLLEKDSKYLKEAEYKQLQVMSDNGQSIGFCQAMMKKGRIVKICDETATIYDPILKKEVPYRTSRVIGYTHPLDIINDHPTIKVGVSGVYSRLADIENKLRKNKNG